MKVCVIFLKFKNQELIHFRDAKNAEFFSYFIQSGDNDWMKKMIPSGVLQLPFVRIFMFITSGLAKSHKVGEETEG